MGTVKIAQETASVTVTLTDEISEPLARIQESFDRLSTTMRQLSNESRGAFQPQEEGARALTQRFRDVKEAGEKFSGSMRGELVKVGQELGKTAAEATGVGKAFNVAAESVSKFSFAVRGLTAAGAIGGIGAIAFGINAIGKAAFDAYQKQETFRRQLGLSAEQGRLVARSWGEAAESIGESAEKGREFIQSMVEQIEQIRTRQQGAPIIQDLLTGRGEGGIRLAQTLLREVNAGIDSYSIALEHIRDLSKQNVDYQREWAARHGVSLRFVQDIVAAQEKYFKLLDSSEGRAALARLIESQKQLAEAHEQWVQSWIKFEPTWNRILSFGIDTLTKITEEMTKISNMKPFPEIPKSWEEWKDFLFGKTGTAAQPNVFRPGAEPGSGRTLEQGGSIGGAEYPNIHRGPTTIHPRQAGGPVVGGRGYMVGEHGPELFAPSSGGAIASSGATTLALRDIDRRETEQTSYQREMRDVLVWIKNQQEKGGAPGGGGAWGAGGGGLGAGGAGAGGGMGGLPGFGGGGPGGGGGGLPGAPGLRVPTAPGEAPETLEAARAGGFMPPGGAAGFGGGAGGGAAGGVPGAKGTQSGGGVVYQKLLDAYKNSGLVGTVPPDGARFGFKTGSAEEWARFGTAVASAESGFKPGTKNLSDPGGSFGIFQYAHGQVPGKNAYDIDASVAAFVRDSKSSVESGRGLRGGILGARFSTIGRHPERTAGHLAEAGRIAGAAGPGGDGGSGFTTASIGAAITGDTRAGAETPGAPQGLDATTALGIARQHLGEDEIRDESKLSSWFKSKNINISPRTTAWCAAFVNSSLSQAGIKGTGSLAAASFYKYGTHVDPKNVQPGDIAVYPHHVGFVESAAGGQYQMLGGNQGGTVSGRGGVSERLRSMRGAEFRRPPPAVDRAAIDRSLAHANTQKVELGKGQIDVHFRNAPKGMKTKANGDGALKDIRVAQTPQMNTTGSYGGDSSNQYSEE